MVLPLLPIGVGIATGLGGFGLGSLFGKTKKEQRISQPSIIDIFSPHSVQNLAPVFNVASQFGQKLGVI